MTNVWGMTDIGLVRRENQDNYLFREQTPSGHTICVVCDGMGGPAGGKIASEIAVETFITTLEAVLRWDMTPEELQDASAYASSLANDAIRNAAEEMDGYENMGTTLVGAVTYAEGVVITNVGDSRAYHIKEDGIVRITRDHSLVAHKIGRAHV